MPDRIDKMTHDELKAQMRTVKQIIKAGLHNEIFAVAPLEKWLKTLEPTKLDELREWLAANAGIIVSNTTADFPYENEIVDLRMGNGALIERWQLNDD